METSLNALDWQDPCSLCFLNPRLPSPLKRQVLESLSRVESKYPAHIWLATSGTSNSKKTSFRLKLVALSKTALLHSAEAVNNHLAAQSTDVWVNPLPFFHVGGLGVFARAFLAGNTVYPVWKENQRWRAAEYVEQLEQHQGTLTSLVPTQVFDLVEQEFKPPPKVRAVLVGGAALAPELYKQARRLGWPLLPSYGMSEAASQVATAPLTSLRDSRFEFPDLQILSHCKVQASPQGQLGITSKSLLTVYGYFGGDGTIEVEDPKQENMFWSEDHGRVLGNKLVPSGRSKDYINICGEKTYLDAIENELLEVAESHPPPFVVVAQQDPRSGQKLILIVQQRSRSLNSPGESSFEVEKWLQHYNQSCLPVFRISQWREMIELPRNALGKIERSKIADSPALALTDT